MHTYAYSADRRGVHSPPVKALHRFTMALAKGDVLVLTTNRQEDSEPLLIIHVDDIEFNGGDIRWWMSTNDGRSLSGGLSRRYIHDGLRFSPAFPLKVVSKFRGSCVLFNFEIDKGYYLHHANFLKSKYPEIYAKLNLS